MAHHDDEPVTWGDVANRRAHLTNLCEHLGLDPSQTTSVKIDLPPDGRAVVSWEGRRRLTTAETAQLVQALIERAKP